MPDDGKQGKNRVPFTKAAQVTAGGTVACTGIDIGGGGIGISSPQEFKSGDNLAVAFAGGPPAQGTVRWIKAEGGSWKVGVQIRAEDWPALAKFAGVSA